jgi:anti-sigma-K factor RskA
MRAADFVPWAIAAALSFVLVAIGISGRRQMADTEKLQRALSILNDPATKDVSFGQSDKSAEGRVFLSPAKGVVLIAANLPRIDASKTFELWVIPAKGNPAPEGIFQSQPDATAVFAQRGSIASAAEVTVTVEPEGGSPKPTTAPFIVARL